MYSVSILGYYLMRNVQVMKKFKVLSEEQKGRDKYEDLRIYGIILLKWILNNPGTMSTKLINFGLSVCR